MSGNEVGNTDSIRSETYQAKKAAEIVEDYRLLQSVHNEIVERIDGNELLDPLFQEGVINAKDMEVVRVRTTPSERTSCLLMTLHRRKPPNIISILVQVFEGKCRWDLLSFLQLNDGRSSNLLSPDELHLRYNYDWKRQHFAAANGDIYSLKRAICTGDKLNERTITGDTPLLIAMVNGKGDVVDWICDQYRCKPGTKSLLKSMEVDNINGPVKSKNDQPPRTIAYHLAKQLDFHALVMLTKNGADLNAVDSDGNAVAHLLVWEGITAALEKLLDACADKEVRDANGQRPVHLAVMYNQPECLQLLLRRACEVNAKDKNGRTALKIGLDMGLSASSSNDTHKGNWPMCIDELFRAYEASWATRHLMENSTNFWGLNLDGQLNCDRLSMLHKAAAFGNHQVIAILLEAGADINRIDKMGNTPLHKATISGNTLSVQQLLKYRAGVDNINQSHHTELYYAAKYGFTKIAEHLLLAGADPERKGVVPFYKTWFKKNWTPYKMAKEKRNREIVTLMQKARAK